MVASNRGRHSLGCGGSVAFVLRLYSWVKLYPEDYDPKNIDYVLRGGAEIHRNYCSGSFFNSHASLQQLIRGLRW